MSLRECVPPLAEGVLARNGFALVSGHLQGRDPPLTALVKQRKLTGCDDPPEVREHGAALGQRETQVAVAKLAQLIRHAYPAEPLICRHPEVSHGTRSQEKALERAGPCGIRPQAVTRVVLLPAMVAFLAFDRLD